MEELASIWCYQETIDELKQQLLYKTLELESVKAQANEEANNHEAKVNQLLHHLNTASKERDEAQEQIQKLINKLTSFNQFEPSKVNSTRPESNSSSDTYIQSPNDPFFDIVSLPNSRNLENKSHQKQQPTFVVDKGCSIIDALVKGKTLPQKGKLLQTVLEAGPLLKTLFVVGLLPRWKNPPTTHIKNVDVFSFSEIGCGTSQIFSSGSLTHINNGLFVNVSDYGSMRKHLRSQ